MILLHDKFKNFSVLCGWFKCYDFAGMIMFQKYKSGISKTGSGIQKKSVSYIVFYRFRTQKQAMMREKRFFPSEKNIRNSFIFFQYLPAFPITFIRFPDFIFFI